MYKEKCQTPGPDGYAGPVIVDIGMAGMCGIHSYTHTYTHTHTHTCAGAGNSQNIEHPTPEFFVFVDDTHHGYTRITADTHTW